MIKIDSLRWIEWKRTFYWTTECAKGSHVLDSWGIVHGIAKKAPVSLSQFPFLLIALLKVRFSSLELRDIERHIISHIISILKCVTLWFYLCNTLTASLLFSLSFSIHIFLVLYLALYIRISKCNWYRNTNAMRVWIRWIYHHLEPVMT